MRWASARYFRSRVAWQSRNVHIDGHPLVVRPDRRLDRAGAVEMVGVQAIRAPQVVVGPVVHPQRPVEVARGSGDLVQPHPELRRWHVRHGVPIGAPRGLNPEDSSRRGVFWIAVPAGDDEVEDLLRRSEGHGIPIGQIALHVEQPHPFVVVVEEVCAAAVGAERLGGIARQSGRAPGCVPIVLLRPSSRGKILVGPMAGDSGLVSEVGDRDVHLGKRPLVGVRVVPGLDRIPLTIEP